MPQAPLARVRPLAFTLVPHSGAWVGAALLLLAFTGFSAAQAVAQPKAPVVAASGAGPAVKPAAAKPLWRDLTARQQRALQPLAAHWDSLTEPHKRKWLAVSRSYAKLPPEDQQTLHSRMTEWAALSPQQRVQARHNFAEVKQVPADERRAKWEAYQALSDEEKQKLAARALPRPPGAAGTIQPTPMQRLAPLPTAASDGQHMPRIQLAPSTAAAPVRPLIVAPAATSPAATSPPVSAEAQVPPPSAAPLVVLPTPSVSTPSVRVTEQPSSAP